MNATEINALSQKQAKAIVNARQQTSTTTLTETEVKTQIQLQAQALVHAHTQAQIALNIYKGDVSKAGATSKSGTAAKESTTTTTTSAAASSSSQEAKQPVAKKPRLAPLTLNPAQMIQQNNLTKNQSNQRAELQKNQRAQLASLRQQYQKENTANPPTEATIQRQAEQLQAMQEQQCKERNDQTQMFREQMQELQESFRRDQSSAATAAAHPMGSEAPASTMTPNAPPKTIPPPVLPPPPPTAAPMKPTPLPTLKHPALVKPTGTTTTTTAPTVVHSIPSSFPLPPSANPPSAPISTITSLVPPPEPVQVPAMTTVTSSEAVGTSSSIADQPDSTEFQSHLQSQLTTFWKGQLEEMHKLPIGTEHDFKNHNDLPLARIKRIMKSDEDVRMISAEAPVLFAKACEMFILELTLRSWNYSESSKRRTLQKEDLQAAIKKTDVFDFLVDVIN
jgi:histone H3/H4